MCVCRHNFGLSKDVNKSFQVAPGFGRFDIIRFFIVGIPSAMRLCFWHPFCSNVSLY